MPVSFVPLPGPFGHRVVLDDASLDDARQAIQNQFNESGLLLFRGLDLDHDQLIELTRFLGEPEIHPIERIRMPGRPEIILLGRPAPEFAADDPAGDVVMGQLGWHTDMTYTVRPGRGALLYASTVPPELGQTRFIDTAQVYDALPDEVKARIDDLETLHSFEGAKEERSQEEMANLELPTFPEVIHPLVYRHPLNGRKVLNISPVFSRSIIGMEPAEGDELLAWLKQFATQEHFVYSHDWQVGDIIAWDNWRTMHSAAGFRARHTRIMYRTTLLSDFVPGRLAA